MRRGLALVVVVLVAATVGTVAPTADRTLSRDVLGWEGGYWWDDPVDVTVEDGLNASERTAVTARAMARVERLRGLEFRKDVTVGVVSRESYLANRTGTDGPPDEWNNQVWKALFLVGDDADVGDVFDGALGASVVGYYRPGSGEIVLVSDSETPTVAKGTLVHELVHALQDQHFGLGGTRSTQDGELARDGVVEGEANRLQFRYDERCREAWSCVDVPSMESGDPLTEYERNVFRVVYFPYAAGPDFVERVASDGGTEALNDLYSNFPTSSEQIVHPGTYPVETPRNVTVADRSDATWDRFDHEPVADTVGEASIFAMVSVHGVGDGGDDFDYEDPVSAGWAGDSLVPYRDGDRFGYVWETAWDSTADAREFHDAYREILRSHDATAEGDGRFVVPGEDPFGGAYRVTRTGETVRIVHGPTLEALAGIHAP